MALRLGYWGLFNLGILHRDVSAGNVLLLRWKQQYARRGWKDQSDDDLHQRFGPMAKSEEELRRILKPLDRDPKGMLTDFDMHDKVSVVPAAQPNAEEGDPKLLSAKRRKLEDEVSASGEGPSEDKSEIAHWISTVWNKFKKSGDNTSKTDYRKVRCKSQDHLVIGSNRCIIREQRLSCLRGYCKSISGSDTRTHSWTTSNLFSGSSFIQLQGVLALAIEQ